jgi:hypothetical protein
MILGLATNDDARILHRLLHPTGEFAARFMIIAMMATPLTLLLPGWRGPRWLTRRRRYLSVATFAYALAHTLLYLVDEGMIAFTSSELMQTVIWTWMAGVFDFRAASDNLDGRLGANFGETLEAFAGICLCGGCSDAYSLGILAQLGQRGPGSRALRAATVATILPYILEHEPEPRRLGLRPFAV